MIVNVIVDIFHGCILPIPPSFSYDVERTKIIHDDDAPEWNEKLIFNLNSATSDLLRSELSVINIRVYDYDQMSKDDFIGETFLFVNPVSMWYSLTNTLGLSVELGTLVKILKSREDKEAMKFIDIHNL